MQIIMVLSLLLSYFIQISCMDAPASAAEKGLSRGSIKFEEEKSKFEKYHLEDPQEFTKLLRKRLGQGDDLSAYLSNLHRLATKLLLQDALVQQLARREYIEVKILTLEDETDKYVKQISSEKSFTSKGSEVGYELTPQTAQDLNELIAHQHVLYNEFKIPEDLKIIFSWILDNPKGSFLSILGYSKKNEYENVLLNPLFEKEDTIEKFNYPLAEFLAEVKELPFIKDNTTYLQKISDVTNNYVYKRLQLEKYIQAQRSKISAQQIIRQLSSENNKIIDEYTVSRDFYKKMYAIVYAELKSEIAKNIKENPGIIKYVKSTPQIAIDQGFLPKTLPAQLPEFVNPSKVIMLPAVNEQFMQAQKEWEQKPRAIPVAVAVKKKKPKHKKRLPIQSESESGETEQEETESVEEKALKKLIVGSDGSYIVEGGDSPIRITIYNDVPQYQNILFKTEKPFSIKQKLPAIDYTNWVKMWFENPHLARKEQGYTNPKSKKYRAGEPEWKPTVLHAFSRLVDDYIMQWGTLTQVDSKREPGKKDYLITIPGMIVFPDGKEETGVYAYLIDSKTGQWYHRMFESQSSKRILDDLFEKGYFTAEMSGYYDVYFPPLGK